MGKHFIAREIFNELNNAEIRYVGPKNEEQLHIYRRINI